jgi:tRNA-splicing ligase RtcB
LPSKPASHNEKTLDDNPSSRVFLLGSWIPHCSEQHSMPIKRIITKSKVPVKIYTDDVDHQALTQLTNIAQLPFIHSHVAAMPDVHVGIGATVGAVIPTKGAIIPAAVGVDIGCGMNAVRLSLKASQLPDNLRPLRAAIETAVPVGFAMHADKPGVPASAVRALDGGLDRIIGKHPGILKMQKHVERIWAQQLGTLGGGNHFIELCLDENQDLWVMLHSGSRGIGNIIGRYFIDLARKDMGKHLASLPDRDLAYLKEGAEHFDDYVEAVRWAQDYAMTNRREMMRLILDALGRQMTPFTLTKEAINCHHNYVAVERHFGEELYVTRKGAIRAGEGDLGIIPGSMGAKSYIVRGKGEPESFCSCSHGAGRRMSRGKAKKAFDPQDLIAQTAGVECRKDAGVLDEIPGAYKDIDEVMANQADLVEVVHTLKQVVCVKG